MKDLVSLLAIACLINVISADEKKMIYSIVIANQGHYYPAEKLKLPDNFPYIPNTITEVGARQMFLLGLQVYTKYTSKGINLIDKTFVQTQISFTSIYSNISSIDASAYAFASGLYTNGTGHKLDNFQQKRAVPPTNFTNYTNFTKELKDDALIHGYNSIPLSKKTKIPNYPFEAVALCSNVSKIVAKYMNNTDVKEEFDKKWGEYKKSLFPSMETALNLSNGTIKSWDDALKYREHIIFYKYKAISLKFDKYALLDDLYDTAKYKRIMGDELVAKLGAYQFLMTTNDAINAKKFGYGKKMAVYVVNDNIILSLLKLFNYTGPVAVSFASSIFIDIFNDTNGCTVNFYYNGKSDRWKYPTMKLSEFKTIVNASIIPKFDNVCGIIPKPKPKPNPNIAQKGVVVAAVVVGSFTVCLLVFAIIYFITNRKNSENENEIENETTMEA